MIGTKRNHDKNATEGNTARTRNLLILESEEKRLNKNKIP